MTTSPDYGQIPGTDWVRVYVGDGTPGVVSIWIANPNQGGIVRAEIDRVVQGRDGAARRFKIVPGQDIDGLGAVRLDVTDLPRGESIEVRLAAVPTIPLDYIVGRMSLVAQPEGGVDVQVEGGGGDELNDLAAICTGIAPDQVPVGTAPDLAVYTNSTGSGNVVRATAPVINGPHIGQINSAQQVSVDGVLYQISAANINEATMLLNNSGAGQFKLQVIGNIEWAGGTPGNIATLYHLNSAPRLYTFPDKSGTIAMLDDIPGGPAPVTSVFGRTGDVLAESGDYDHGQLTSIGVNGHDVIDAHLADEDVHVPHSLVEMIAGNGLTGGGTIAQSRTFDVVEAEIDHDKLLNHIPDQHIGHSGVSIIAGNGMTGGGDITQSRTMTVGASMSIQSTATTIRLVNDQTSPGNSKLYGTNASGVKGWYDQPEGGGPTTPTLQRMSVTLQDSDDWDWIREYFLGYVSNAVIGLRCAHYQIGGTAVQWQVRYAPGRSGTPTDLFAGPITSLSPNGVTTDASGGNPNIPAGSWIWLEVLQVTGVVADFGCTLEYEDRS